jgi:hypothetical protein
VSRNIPGSADWRVLAAASKAPSDHVERASILHPNLRRDPNDHDWYGFVTVLGRKYKVRVWHRRNEGEKESLRLVLAPVERQP